MKNAALLLAITLIEYKTIACHLGCRFRGYDAGYFREDSCFCIDKFKYDDVTKKKIILPTKVLRKGEPTVYYNRVPTEEE